MLSARLLLVAALLVAVVACAESESSAGTTATTETPTTAAATTTTTTEPEPTTTTTTTVPVTEPEPDLEESFVEYVKEAWARTARTRGGEVPDLTDEEILDIGRAVCEQIAVDPTVLSSQKTLESYAEVAAIITERMGLPYDPALLDAGYESSRDSSLVDAFAHAGNLGSSGALCPEFDPSPNVTSGKMFRGPWSVAAADS
jgi:hypothetical protein